MTAAVEAAETATSVHVPSGRCVAANDLVAQITGRPRSAMLGRRISDVLMDGDPSTDERLFDGLQRDGVARERFHTFIPGRGFRWLEVTACRSLVVGRRLFQVQWEDVTTRMCAEDAATPAAAGRNGTTSLVSACLAGRSAEDVLAAVCDALDARAACVTTSPLAEKVVIEVRRGIDLPSVKRRGSIFETLSELAGGELLTLEDLAPECPIVRGGGFTSARAVQSATGAPGEGLLVVFDPERPVTDDDARAVLEGAAAALSLHRLRDELDRLSLLTHLSDEVSHLARGIAHGINNDLTCILGNTFQLRSALPDDVSVARHVCAIEESSAHAARVASALQNLVRASARRETDVDLGGLIQSAVTLIQGASKRTEIQVRCDRDVPSLRADRHALLQASLNLLQNAIDAVEEGGSISFTARCVRTGAGEAVELAVRDDGRGIPAEHVSRVRDAGFTTLAESTGRGLGLTIVDRIVQRHGGTMALDSVEGVGTTVRLTIPLRESEGQ